MAMDIYIYIYIHIYYAITCKLEIRRTWTNEQLYEWLQKRTCDAAYNADNADKFDRQSGLLRARPFFFI